MPMTVTAAALAVAISLPLFLWSVLPRRNSDKELIWENLSRGLSEQTDPSVRHDRPLLVLARRLTTARAAVRMDRLHALAGRPTAWPVSRLLAAKPALAATALLFGLFVVGGRMTGVTVLFIAVAGVAYFVPELLLYSRGSERQKTMGLELPDTLDQMLIAVEAGLGFDAAMGHVGEKGNGPLAEEMIRTLQDMRLGRSRREAYEDLAKRTSVPDLNTFIRAVIQADIYGISISKVLRTQSNEMRLKRSQRAEEKAMQVPVKVMIPLILFILPVLFIVLLGPAVLTVMDSMG